MEGSDVKREASRIYEMLEPKSRGQERIKEALESDSDIIGIFGPSGTGKSLFSISYGFYAVAKGEYERLVLARPVVDVTTGKEVTMISDPVTYRKIASEYIQDITGLPQESIQELQKQGLLVLVDPHFLRGRTFDKSIILIDDAQSVKPETIVEIITRLGQSSRLIIAGDPVFQRSDDSDGATLAREILLGEDTATVVDLGVKDIVRNGARRGIRLLLELRMRKRSYDEIEGRVRDSIRLYAPDADVITVVNLVDLKRAYEIRSDHTPDALVIVKQGHLGRLIGSEGARIQAIEEDTGLRIRGIEFASNITEFLKEIVRAIHPVSWVHKHIRDADFAGPMIKFTVDKSGVGPMMGQKGVHVRFLDDVIHRLIGARIRIEEAEEKREAGRRRGRRR